MSAHWVALLSIALACMVGAGHVAAYYNERTSPPLVLAALTDDEVRDRIIRESIARYSGSCPCPYTLDRAGRRCGARSAWSRAGGAAPLCFRAEITEEMISAWRAADSG